MKMSDKKFTSTFKNMKYGLVRLSPNLTLIDKNEMAEAVMTLPKRGSSMTSYFKDAESFLSELSKTEVATVAFYSQSITRNAVAFLEADGNVLLLFHPLLSAICLGNSYERVKKLLKNHCKNIFNLLEVAENGGIAQYSASYSAARSFFGGFDGRDLFTVAGAVANITEKLSQTVMKKELSVLIDNKCKTVNSCVRFTQVEYALGELIAMREYYGRGENATLRIGCGENCLVMALIDKADSETGRIDEYYLKIFGEFMRIVDIGTSVHVNSCGELIVKLYLPYARVNRFMQNTYVSVWNYFDYMREYFEK